MLHDLSTKYLLIQIIVTRLIHSLGVVNTGCSFTSCSEEECDDGNLSDADGCSTHCKVEEEYICTGNILPVFNSKILQYLK